jgi:hypothetical protein
MRLGIQRERERTTNRENLLRGRRRSRSAVEGERTRWRRMIRKVAVSRDLLYFRNQVQPGDRQHRSMQDLTNVAGCVGAAMVRVKKR